MLLPVIIFESGYSLKRSYFFSQLGSIVAFAIAGTCVATFFTGALLYAWGDTYLLGTLHRLSWEECYAFAGRNTC